MSCLHCFCNDVPSLWGLWSLCGVFIRRGGISDSVCGYMSQSERSLMFAHVSRRIWGLWYACHYNYQHVKGLSWVHAKGVSFPVHLCFCEHGCEVSYLSAGVCLSVWGLWGPFGFASHRVRSLSRLGAYLLSYEACLFIISCSGMWARPVTIYHCMSWDVRSLAWVYIERVRSLIYLWLYVPGCEVSDQFMELILTNGAAMSGSKCPYPTMHDVMSLIFLRGHDPQCEVLICSLCVSPTCEVSHLGKGVCPMAWGHLLICRYIPREELFPLFWAVGPNLRVRSDLVLQILRM